MLLGIGLASPCAFAQLGDPGAAKAVTTCEQNVSNAGRTFIRNSYKALKKCVDAIFTCVQLKADDAGCLPKAQGTCDKQFANLDTQTLKLELAVDRRCAEEIVPFATLRSALAANLGLLANDCQPYGVVVLGSLDNYEDCLLGGYQCRVGELLRFAAPRATEMLGLVGRGLTTCPTPMPGPTPTVTATPQFNRVFVTSTLQAGDFGGLAGADAICAARATEADLPGTYVAWLSTSTVNAATRLGSAQGFVRIDGKPFANTVADMLANEIFNPLRISESGADISAVIPTGSSELTVFTGTLSDGTVSAGFTCDDYTATTGNARRGSVSGGPVTWTARQNSNCSTMRRLYCFQTDHTGVDLVPPTTTGNIAFVTTKNFTPGPGVGIAGADALCASDASAASLPGTYKALLATTTASAASRMTLAALYVRPDGIPIATGSTIAAGSTLGSGIWQRANGAYVPASGDLAYTGAPTPSTTGTLTSTCSDWTSTATPGAMIGADTFADPTWWDLPSTNPVSCAQTITVYCLQQ